MNISISNKILYTACLIILLSFLCPPLAVRAQNNGFTITGHIAGLNDGDNVVLDMIDIGRAGRPAKDILLDSAIVKNGQFMLKGDIKDGPRYVWLNLNHRSRRTGKNDGRTVMMVIDDGQNIRLTSTQDIETITHAFLNEFITIEGSPTCRAWELMYYSFTAYDQPMHMLNNKLKTIRDSIGYDECSINALMQTRLSMRVQFNHTLLNWGNVAGVKLGTYPCGALWWAHYFGDDHDPVWADVYKSLDEHQKNGYYGSRLKKVLPILVGQFMPGFSLPKPDGEKVSLADFVKKNKITLVYFWANESAQRRDYDSDLRAMYKKYHDKGLDIISVSTESEDEDWKAALEKEKYPWTNVHDRRGKIVVDTVYNEYGRPAKENSTNVLLDEAGRIVAWDPTGVELQWYIENTLRSENQLGTRNGK